MNFTFKEIAERNAQGDGKVPYDVLCEVMEQVARSGEPIAVTVRKANAKRRAMLEDFRRAIEYTRWLKP